MAILNPGDLLKQASRLIQPPPAGPPLQVDIRRAISSAYYAVFHATLAAAADEFVGRKYRSSSRYAYLYRAIDHGRLRSICKDARKAKPQAKPGDDLSSHGFGKDIRDFAEKVVVLQEARHGADYDPSRLFRTLDAQSAINTAHDAMRCFGRAGTDDRKALLTLLLCQGRR